MSHGEPTTEGTNMDDHGETGTESPGTEVTSMMLMRMLMEQQRLAREQQAAQQEVLLVVRLVEQQREEMARYREEMRSVRTREEAAAARRGRNSRNRLFRSLARKMTSRTSSPHSRESPNSKTGPRKCGLPNLQAS